jgi:hypothetical protein
MQGGSITRLLNKPPPTLPGVSYQQYLVYAFTTANRHQLALLKDQPYCNSIPPMLMKASHYCERSVRRSQ